MTWKTTNEHTYKQLLLPKGWLAGISILLAYNLFPCCRTLGGGDTGGMPIR